MTRKNTVIEIRGPLGFGPALTSSVKGSSLPLQTGGLFV
jgi:hypothetical protein